MFKTSGLLHPGSSVGIDIWRNQCSLLIIIDGFSNSGALYIVGDGYESTRVLQVFSSLNDELSFNCEYGQQTFTMTLADDYPAICTYTLLNCQVGNF